MLNFYQAVEEKFPKAKDFMIYLGEANQVLNKLGFTKENTLPALSICRDEILTDFKSAVTISWGNPFILGGLAGVLISGKTGLAAFSHHAQNIDDDTRFFFVIAPHIGIGENGKLCSTKRKNRKGHSSACGSLVNVLVKFQAQNGNFEPAFRKDDIGQSFVETCLAPFQKEILSAKDPEIAMVEKAFEVTLRDLETYVKEIPDFVNSHVAVLGGIIINASFGFQDFFVPRTFYVSKNGVKQEYKLG